MLRSGGSGSRHASRLTLSPAAVCHAVCSVLTALPLRKGTIVGVYEPGGTSTVIFARTCLVLTVALAYVLGALRDLVMRAPSTYTRATRQVAIRWYLLVGIRWQRLQGRISGFYFRRVTEPWQFWHALGCPQQFTPRIPWWQPWVYRWLVLTGWVRPQRRQRRV